MAETNADRRERVGELVRIAETDPAALDDRVAELETYLAADSAYVRRLTARAVARLAGADAGAVVPLVDALAERLPDEAAQEDAASALGRVAEEDPDAVMAELAALVAALDGGGDVLVPASGALASLAGADAGTLAQPGILDRLYDLLSNERPAVRGNAAAALADIAAVDAAAVCSGADDLRARLDDDTAPVRRDAAVALGTAAPTCPDAVVAAVPRLDALLDDPDGGVRAAAAYALGHALRAEGAGQRTVDVLLDAIDDSATPVRQHATFALASLAAEDPDLVRPGVDALARRTVDESAAVRRNARSALAALEDDYQTVVAEALDDVRAELEAVDEGTETVPYTATQLRGLAGDDDAPADQRAAADHALALVESGTVSPASTTDEPADPDDTGPRFCPNCGETVEEGGEFCPACGTTVE